MFTRNKQTKIWLILPLVILLIYGMKAHSQEEIEKAKAPFKPAETPRLYNAPTADIIQSLDLSIAGGSSYGAKGASFQGTIGFGLAGIAQIEANAMGIVSDLKDDSFSNVYAPGFKMMLLREGKWSYSWLNSPGVAWALRSSVWREERRENIMYNTKVADLYFVATERLGPLSIHAGLDIFDARLKTDIMEQEDFAVAKQNFFRPFGGLDIWVTERGKAMAEFGWTPSFKYAKDGIQKDKDIEPTWVAMLGVRFFVTRYTALDVGVRYQKDYEGVSDATIEAKIDTFIPTHLLYEHARGRQ